MIRVLIIIITSCFFCIACGVKDDPKYQSKRIYNKITIV